MSKLYTVRCSHPDKPDMLQTRWYGDATQEEIDAEAKPTKRQQVEHDFLEAALKGFGYLNTSEMLYVAANRVHSINPAYTEALGDMAAIMEQAAKDEDSE